MTPFSLLESIVKYDRMTWVGEIVQIMYAYVNKTVVMDEQQPQGKGCVIF